MGSHTFQRIQVLAQLTAVSTALDAFGLSYPVLSGPRSARSGIHSFAPIAVECERGSARRRGGRERGG